MTERCQNCHWMTKEITVTEEGYRLCKTCYREYKKDMLDMEMKK